MRLKLLVFGGLLLFLGLGLVFQPFTADAATNDIVAGEDGDKEKDKDDGDKEGDKGDGDKEKDEDENKGDDAEWKDFEKKDNPFTKTSYYQKAIKKLETLKKKGSCWEVLLLRMEILRMENRYWLYQTDQASEAYNALMNVASELQVMYLKSAKLRTTLEKTTDKDKKECVEKNDAIQEAFETAKMQMRKAAWYLEEQEGQKKEEFTKEGVIANQEKALLLINNLKNKIKKFDEDLLDEAEQGNEDVYFAKEIIFLAKENFNIAVNYYNAAEKETNNKKREKDYVAAIAEGNLGMDVFAIAKDYKDGDKEDKAGDSDKIKGIIKILFQNLADKQEAALYLKDATEREEILTKLKQIEEELLVVEKSLAEKIYDETVDESVIDSLKESLAGIKESLAAIKLDSMDKKEWSKAKKKKKANDLIKSARKHIKELKKKVNKKEDKADTEDEDDLVLFADQTTLQDAKSDRKTAKTYKKKKDYREASKSAYTSIKTAKAGKEVLKGVK